MAAKPSSGKAHDPRYKALIARLTEARKTHGLSQSALASRLGKHQQFVSRYETGERRLDVIEFLDIAKALGLEPAGLIGAAA